jgi:hypothetical protein
MPIAKKAKSTITPVEMNIGDTVAFTLLNGFTNRIELTGCSASIVETNKKDLTTDFPAGGTLLRMDADILINGFPMKLRRFVGCQESFYEPYIINGMQLWFDAARCLFDIIQENHGECMPLKDVRFVLADNSMPVCPEELSVWCDLYGKDRIDISDCYDGDDCFLGAYHGASAHGGLDINHPGGTPIYAPFSLDDQYYFNSLKSGDNNNRWRGVRHWNDETTWAIQVHHIGIPLVKEYIPVGNGAEIAKGAMVFVGSHEHSHFAFKVYEDGYEYILDPWILFRQMFKRIRGDNLSISIKPKCCILGEQIYMEAQGAPEDAKLFWKISDGSCYFGRSIKHAFTRSGIHSILLYAKGKDRPLCTLQYITVMGRGRDVSYPRLSIEAEDRGFANLQHPFTLTFGEPVCMPNVLDISVFETEKRVFYKTIKLNNNSPLPFTPDDCTFECSAGFIEIVIKDPANMIYQVKVDTRNLEGNEYLERIDIKSSILNGSQTIWVKVNILPDDESDTVICSCTDRNFWKTGYTLVGHKFRHWHTSRGYSGIYLTNGPDKDKEVKAVFQPVLKAGRYKVGFTKHDKLDRHSIIRIRVTSKDGVREIDYIPKEDLEIGEFAFDSGNDGRVEILTGECTGPAIIDAVYFKRV